MLTSLSHAKTLLVSSSALPVSPSNSDTSRGQMRVTVPKQPGPVVGLLLYATGTGVVLYVLSVSGNRRKNEKWLSSSYRLGLEERQHRAQGR